MILGGYALGRSIPNIGQKIHYVIAVVVVLSLLPAVISVLRERRKYESRRSRQRHCKQKNQSRTLAPQKIRAIIFDIGRVLVRLDIAGAMGGLAGRISLSPRRNLGGHRTRSADGATGRKVACLRATGNCIFRRRLGVEMSFEEFSEIWNRVLDPTPADG